MRSTKLVAGALVAAVLMSGCSTPQVSEEGERTRLGRERSREEDQARREAKEAKAADKKAAEEQAAEVAEEAAGGGTAAGGAAGGPSGFGGPDTPRSGIDPSLAKAAARIEEPQPDAKKKGVVADYPEMLATSIQGLGRDVRITFTFAANVPQKLPKDTFMVVSIGITGRKEDEAFAFGANADDSGWRPYAGSKGKARKFPGSFAVRGNEIVMQVPWTSVEGPRRFEWFVTASWFSQLAGQSSYSFDVVPNDDAGTFPN